MQPEPKQRVAIFGATSGIAKAVSRALATRGTRIVLVGRDAAALSAAADDLRVRGATETEVIVGDFARLEAMDSLVERAWNALEGLDACLVAYGSLPDQARAQADCTTAREALTLNFVSPALLLEPLAARFAATGSGVIAVITSVAGDRGRQSNYIYGAAKGGLQRYLEGLRHRLHGAGVAVLDIRPGFVRTPMTAHLERGGPLWADAEKVARDILAAMDGRRAVLYTPFFWRYVLTLIRALPRPLMHKTKL